MKSFMKTLEKGKALEESENKKIVELTGRVLNDTIKLILDVLFCPFWTPQIVFCMLCYSQTTVILSYCKEHYPMCVVQKQHTTEIHQYHSLLFVSLSTGKVAVAELAEAKAGDVIKSMEGLVNEAKAKLSITAKGGK